MKTAPPTLHRLPLALALPLMAALLGGAIVAQFDVDNRWMELRTKPAPRDYVLPGSILRALSMGQNGLLADIYWTRAVQYFGSQRLSHSLDFSMLEPYINTAVTLDPQLVVAYYAGGFFLSTPEPRGAGRPDLAVDLLKRGIKANPDYWRLWHHLGFTYYWDLGDYEKAAAAYAEGAKNPKAQPWMRVMAAAITSKGGSRETSRFLWTEILNSTEDETIRVNARRNLMMLTVADDIDGLTLALQQYARRAGHPAPSFADLVQAGILRQPPRDPIGYLYLLEPDGSVSVNPKSYLSQSSTPMPPHARAGSAAAAAQ
jgi:tetratricopeptide (TPR) repeat protein